MSQSNTNGNQEAEPFTNQKFQQDAFFLEAVEKIKIFVKKEIQKEVEQKQLYYHNQFHADAVTARAKIIFQEILPFWKLIFPEIAVPPNPERIKYLIEICAIAHDMVQDFSPTKVPQTARRREPGNSERQTASKLIEYIRNLNREYPKESHPFSEKDLEIIYEAISATICLYDLGDKSVYQPDLYNRDKIVSITARVIALADLGGLGIEGIESFFDEGALLFIEENIDLIPVIKKYFQQIKDSRHSDVKDSDPKNLDLQTLEYENLRQRLLLQSQFQLNFATGRKNRLDRELLGLPQPVIEALKSRVFIHLTDDNIQQIAQKIPDNANADLEKLVKLFCLDKHIHI